MKTRWTKSQDGILRANRRFEVRLTENEEAMLELAFDNFRKSADSPSLTFGNFILILLKRQLEAQRGNDGTDGNTVVE